MPDDKSILIENIEIRNYLLDLIYILSLEKSYENLFHD